MDKHLKLAGVAFLLMGISGAPQAAGVMDHYLIKLPGRFYELMSEDLNGDGRKDLVASFTEGRYPEFKRSLVVVLQKEGGRFAKQPDQVIPLDERAAIADVADVLPSPGVELLVLDAGGLRAATLQEGKYGAFTRVIERSSLAAAADPRVIPLWDFARDWDGDGASEILLPGFHDTALYNDIAAPPQVLGQGPVSRVRSTYLPGTVLEEKVTIPEWASLDFDGDGKKDLLAFVEDNIAVFRQGESGVFAAQPDPFIPLKLWPDKVRAEREVHSITFGLAPDFYLLADDFDGDGKADFMAMTLMGGIIGLKSEARLYFGKDKGTLQGQPSQTIVLEDAGAGPFFCDFDRDGRKEFVLTYMNMNVSAAAKTVLSGKAEAVSKCYRLGADGRYPQEPSFVYESRPRADFKTITIEGTLPLLCGDFNGDNKADILQGLNKEELSIILQREGAFAQGPALTLPVPSPLQVVNNPLITDLNADGLDEFAVIYPRVEEHAGELHIVINRGDW